MKKTSRAVLFLAAMAWLLPHCGQALYNPSTGRWLSRDPIQESGGINLYAFLNNAPIFAVDPFGHCGCKCLRVHVTYDPGGEIMEGFKWYEDPLHPGIPRYGNQIHVVWEVEGEANECHFFQDESQVTMDVTRPDGSKLHIQGINNESSEDNWDDLGFVPIATGYGKSYRERTGHNRETPA